MSDILDMIDATVDGRCGCGCGAVLSPSGSSGWFESEACQDRFQGGAAGDVRVDVLDELATGTLIRRPGGVHTSSWFVAPASRIEVTFDAADVDGDPPDDWRNRFTAPVAGVYRFGPDGVALLREGD